MLTLVLFAGHGSDTARALATLFGTAAERSWCAAPPGRHRPRRAPTGPSSPTRARSSSRRSFALGAGTLVTLVVPEPDGVLSPFADAMSDRATVLVGVLLVGAAWLVQRGRRTGLVLAAGLLVTLSAVLADVFLIEPLQDGFVQWQGLTTDEVEWQVTLLGAWAVPAAVLLAIVALRGQLVRARFRATPTCGEDYLGMLREGDAGTLGHMGTWRGNATWTHPDGLGAVAYRVHGDVALTVSDRRAPLRTGPRWSPRSPAPASGTAGPPRFTSVHEPVRAILAAEGWASFPVDGVRARRDDVRPARQEAPGPAHTRPTVPARRAPRRVDHARRLDADQRAQVETICTRWAADRRLPEMGFTLGGFRELEDRTSDCCSP